jgi:hypothetical protein
LLAGEGCSAFLASNRRFAMDAAVFVEHERNIVTMFKLCAIATSIESFGSDAKSSLVNSYSIMFVAFGSCIVGKRGVVMLSFIAST